MAMAELGIVPLGTGTTSVSRYVAKTIEVIRAAPEVEYEPTAMGTIITGDLPSIFKVINQVHEALFCLGTGRLVTTIKIDDRRDKRTTTTGKIAAVKDKLTSLNAEGTKKPT